MTFDDFNKFTEDLLNEVRHIRNTKGKEYTHSEDSFDNFNRLATRLNLSRQKIWQVYFTKHLDAIESFIQNQQTFSSESIRGRIVDAIAYLTLLAGMIEEDLNSTNYQFKCYFGEYWPCRLAGTPHTTCDYTNMKYTGVIP